MSPKSGFEAVAYWCEQWHSSSSVKMELLLRMFCSPWFWAEVVLSVSGGLVVYYGLKVEKAAEKHMPPQDFKPDVFEDIVEVQKRKLERGWKILMTGIVMEVIAALGISIISGLESANLTEKADLAKGAAAEANRLAKLAEESASSNSLEVAVLTQTNLMLRSHVAALEKRVIDLNEEALQTSNAVSMLEPRHLSYADAAWLADFLLSRDRSKDEPVRLAADHHDPEAFKLAQQIHSALMRGGIIIPEIEDMSSDFSKGITVKVKSIGSDGLPTTLTPMGNAIVKGLQFLGFHLNLWQSMSPGVFLLVGGNGPPEARDSSNSMWFTVNGEYRGGEEISALVRQKGVHVTMPETGTYRVVVEFMNSLETPPLLKLWTGERNVPTPVIGKQDGLSWSFDIRPGPDVKSDPKGWMFELTLLRR